MSQVQVVVSYYRDGSVYPRSGPEARQREVYWANIAVNAATWRHVAGGDSDFVVYAGDEPTDDARRVLDRAGAEVRPLAFDHRPPDDFYDRYLGTLFVLDTMAALAATVADDDLVVFVDPDIVWVRSPDPLLEEVRRGGIVAYELHVPDDLELCDLTRRQQTEILAELVDDGPDPAGPAITHFGGEIYAMAGAELRELVPRSEMLWTDNLARYTDGRGPYFHMEEHVMNGLLWCHGEQAGRANPHLERIRTLPRPMGSRQRAHPGLVAWHLPIEKDKGFLEVLTHLIEGRPMPPVGPAYERWLARRMGVAPVGGRWLADRARQLKWTLLRTGRGKGPEYGL